MKKISIYGISLIALIILGCSKDISNKVSQEEVQKEPLTSTEINNIIRETLDKEGDFDWNKVDVFVLWSALQLGDNVLTIGYNDKPFSDLNSKSSDKTKQDILNQISELEEGTTKDARKGESILIAEGHELNFIDVYVSELNTLVELRNNPKIRYMEPSGYNYFSDEITKSDSGCDTSPQSINSGDYTMMEPNCEVSWTYEKHKISSAWSYSSGSGVTVGLIDTGVSSEQPLLGSSFNQGYSTGRTIQKFGVYVDSVWPWSTKTDGSADKCGHGTRMASTLAAPRNNLGYPVGVAYNCNLVAYRATGDVVLDGYHEQRGVSQALTELANMPSVKVISMSIGHIFTIGSISDAIKYAYSKGKMIVAAGGTSTTFTNWAGVIFPANMNETVAATGITDDSGYTECAVCHKGSKIDFTVIMQRSYNSDRTSVCLGFYANTRNYVGGSSVATSTTAGIAALIWGRYPTWTRDQVLDRMKKSASLYPNRSDDFGWGSINALTAVQ